MRLFRKKKTQNVLMMKPLLKENVTFKQIDDEKNVLVIYRVHRIEKVLIRLFKQPTSFCVQLDELGSYVASRCMGQYTVQDILDQLCETFEEESELALPRLLKFIEILEVNDWLSWKDEKAGV